MKIEDIKRLWRGEVLLPKEHPVRKHWDKTHGRFGRAIALTWAIAYTAVLLTTGSFVTFGVYMAYCLWLGHYGVFQPNPVLLAVTGGLCYLSILVYGLCSGPVDKFRSLIREACSALPMHHHEFAQAPPERLRKYAEIRLRGITARAQAISALRPMTAEEEAVRNELRYTYNLFVHKTGILEDTGYRPYFG